MDKHAINKYLPGGLLVVGCLMLFSTRSQKEVPLVGSLETVLPTWGDYTVKAQTISPEERKIAGMSDYVARMYSKDSTIAFTTYVGYYDRQTQGKSMHSPRNCLPGAGWEILRAESGTVTAGGTAHTVNKYQLKNGAIQALVLYWYQGRGRVVANEYAVKWNLLRDAALKGHTEEALVRIVVFVPRAAQLDPAALERAFADAEKLGQEVGTKVLTDVARVLPSDPRSVASTSAKGGLAAPLLASTGR
ncbi:MAG: exosortase C-terminal domain/associated protein EpsI [bacterium]